MADWIDAEQAMLTLGVRAQTLYAYVSRGRVGAAAHPDDPRRSLYRASDVAALAAKKARGRRAADVAAEAIAWGEPVLPSAITTVESGRLFYRGQDAVDLARMHSLEQVARLLRGGHGAPLTGPEPKKPKKGETPRARLFSTLAARAGIDPPARGRAPLALAMEAAGLLEAAADAVAGSIGDGAIHQRLADAWSLDASGADLVRRALVLLADHELNASTFAVRVAASTGSSLAAASLAGLAALSGPLHGGMAARVEMFVDEAQRRGPAARSPSAWPRARPCPASATRSIPTATRAPPPCWTRSRSRPCWPTCVAKRRPPPACRPISTSPWWRWPGPWTCPPTPRSACSRSAAWPAGTPTPSSSCRPAS
jgi:citrate synthase